MSYLVEVEFQYREFIKVGNIVLSVEKTAGAAISNRYEGKCSLMITKWIVQVTLCKEERLVYIIK